MGGLEKGQGDMRAILFAVMMVALAAPAGARAGDHYISLAKIFPSGKCSAVAPNFELMMDAFAGGEFTEHKIHDDQGEVVEVITSFVNKDHDQWAIVGLKTETKVIFCLYASGIGGGSVARKVIKKVIK